MKNTIHSVGSTVLALILFSTPLTVFALSDSCEYTGPPAPAKGAFIESLRVMAMNVWGQYDDNEFACMARLNSTGKQIANSTPAFNIVGLTEVHPNYIWMPTCDGKKLVEGIQVNGEYTGNKARWGHPETSWIDHDGGVSLFSTSTFDWEPYSEHVHRYTPELNPRTAHGFIFSRIRVNPEVMIDVYVTHIHSTGSIQKCDQQCKYNELTQLAEGIHERSANSGNPVLVMGDFNIVGPNPTAAQCSGNKGYGDIMDILRNPRDLWLEAHPDQAGSTSLTSSQRIDFMFFPTDPYFTNSPYELVIANPDDVKLIDWKIPGYEYRDSNNNRRWVSGPFAVSDHYGIEAMLEVRHRLDWATVLAAIF